MKVPESLPRFVPLDALSGAPAHGSPALDAAHEFLPLEQLIAANLDDLFPGMEICSAASRSGSPATWTWRSRRRRHDLLSIVDREVRRRRFGACVRLEVDAGIPDRIRQLLKEKLEIDDEDVYESTGPLGLSALMSLAFLPRPDLRDPPFTPRVPPELGDNGDIFAAIAKQDILLHHPYDSFTPVLDFLRRGGRGPAGAGGQDDAVPRRLERRGGAGADPRRRERQAGGGQHRAQGPLRRGQQHRLGPDAGARRGPRVLRRRRA